MGYKRQYSFVTAVGAFPLGVFGFSRFGKSAEVYWLKSAQILMEENSGVMP